MRPCNQTASIAFATLAACATWASWLQEDSASAQHSTQPPVEIRQISLGLGGVVRVGKWIPVRCLLWSETQRSVRIRWSAPSPEGSTCEFLDAESHAIPAGSPTWITSYVRFGRRADHVECTIMEDDQPVVRRSSSPTPEPSWIASTDRVVVVLGSRKQWVDALRQAGCVRQHNLHVVSLERTEDAPLASLGWQSVDAMVLATSGSDPWRDWNEPQWSAFEMWLRTGGRALISLDPVSVREDDIAWTRLLKVIHAHVAGTDQRRDTTGLEGYAGTDQRLDVLHDTRTSRWNGLACVRMAEPSGRVLAFDGGGGNRIAWVRQHALGLGIVTTMAFDFLDNELRDWGGLSKLADQTLSDTLDLEQNPTTESTRGEWRHLGYRDLTGQLQLGMEQFPGIRLFPFSLVASLMVLYILLVGAGDYYFVRKIWKRHDGTWLTTALLVAVACGGAWMWSRSWKGNDLQLQQVDVLDIDGASGAGRMQSWCHIYSPHQLATAIEWQPDIPWLPVERMDHVVTSWSGVPGNGFGGMDARATHSYTTTAIQSESKRDASGTLRITLSEVGLAAYSSRAFEGSTAFAGPLLSIPSLSADRLYRLRGMVRNPFPVELRDSAIYFDRWYYPLGTLRPDAQVELTPETIGLDVRSRLTRRRIEDAKEIILPWNPAATDLGRTMEMMLFYCAAGGESYTQLRHDYWSSLDMSDHLQLERAILVGRLVDDVSQWIFARDEPSPPGRARQAYLRLVIPVRQSTE